MKRTYTKQQLESVILWRKRGLSYLAIQNKTDVGYDTIQKLCRAAGLRKIKIKRGEKRKKEIFSFQNLSQKTFKKMEGLYDDGNPITGIVKYDHPKNEIHRQYFAVPKFKSKVFRG